MCLIIFVTNFTWKFPTIMLKGLLPQDTLKQNALKELERNKENKKPDRADITVNK